MKRTGNRFPESGSRERSGSVPGYEANKEGATGKLTIEFHNRTSLSVWQRGENPVPLAFEKRLGSCTVPAQLVVA